MPGIPILSPPPQLPDICGRWSGGPHRCGISIRSSGYKHDFSANRADPVYHDFDPFITISIYGTVFRKSTKQVREPRGRAYLVGNSRQVRAQSSTSSSRNEPAQLGDRAYSTSAGHPRLPISYQDIHPSQKTTETRRSGVPGPRRVIPTSSQNLL